MRMIILFSFLCALTCSVTSQNAINIWIRDHQTKEPVAYAIVSYYVDNDYGGVYANDQGQASIVIPEEADSIKISCMGYYPATFTAEELPDTIRLKSKIHLLNEIVVRPSANKKYKTIGYAKSKKDIRITSSSGMECAVFIANDYGKELLIKSVLLNMVQRKDITSVIRIHLYSCNDMVMPGKELIHDNLLVYLTKKNDRLIEVDISKYYIKIPESGIFVGMEWIGILDEDTGVIIDANGFEMESFIFFTFQAMQQQTYTRSLKYNWEWDDRMFKELPPYNEKASINAAFGLKVQVD